MTAHLRLSIITIFPVKKIRQWPVDRFTLPPTQKKKKKMQTISEKGWS